MKRRQFLKTVPVGLAVGLSELELLALEKKEVNKTADVYVTAFGGPYGGLSRNPTQDIAEHLSEIGYRTEVLPVDYDRAPRRLRQIIKNEKPRIIVSLGTLGAFDVRVFGDGVYLINDNLVNSQDFYFNVEINVNNNRGGGGIVRQLASVIGIPASNVKYLKQRFDAAGIKYRMNINTNPNHYAGSGTSECNFLAFQGIMATINSRTKFYFFHVPLDISTNPAKKDNIIRAIGALTN